MDLFRKALVRLAAGAVLAWSIVWASAPGSLSAAEGSKTVRIGVLAKRGTQRCLAQWGPTAEYLTAEIPGYTFVVTPLDYHQVRPAVDRGEIDFILANPSLYVELEWCCGASRIVTLNNLCPGGAFTSYAGVIFCRADRNDIQRFRDLKGKTFMAVEEESFGGWQMAWRELKEEGIDPNRDFRQLRFGETHDSVVMAVLDGEVDAGTVRTDTLERMAAEGKIRLDDFRVLHGQHDSGTEELPFLHSTRAYPEWPLAKLRDTPDPLAQNVAIALLKMSPETPAAKAAQCAGWVIPQNYQSVHECLRDLRLGPYRDYGRITLGAVARRYWPWLVAASLLLVLAGSASVYVTRLNRALRYALSGQRKELADRKQAEQTLRLSETRLRQIIDLVPHMIFAKDKESRFLLANRATAAMYHTTVEELTGKKHADVHPIEEELKRFLEDDRAVIESGQPKTIPEEPFMDADGNSRFLHAIKIPYATSGTSEPAVLGVAIDVTERKRAEQALRKSEQLRAESEKLAAVGRLAAGVAHEINNPLTGVLTFAHLLREKSNLDDQDRQDLDLVIHETKRVSEIVRGLLDFARERPVVKQPLDVNDVIRQTLRLLGNRQAFQQITVRTDFQEGLPAVDGDMNQLQQVLLNLSLNACEAMPDGGTLTISTRSQDERVLVKVTDTGCGIKKKHLDQIFEPFFSTKPVGKGTGLGLSVSYGIVQQHGGDLTVQSEEGQGATFTIVLPAAQSRRVEEPLEERVG